MSEPANHPQPENRETQESRLSYKPSLIQWRRDTVLSMYATGKTMTAIAEVLKVDISTVSRDIAYMREQAKEKLTEYFEDLPFRQKLRAANIDKAIAELWTLYENETDTRTKKGILDSITEALIKQAAIDGDPLAIDRALKTVAKIRKITQSEKESSNTGNSAGVQQEELQGEEVSQNA